jgi:hypothetical protein
MMQRVGTTPKTTRKKAVSSFFPQTHFPWFGVREISPEDGVARLPIMEGVSQIEHKTTRGEPVETFYRANRFFDESLECDGWEELSQFDNREIRPQGSV